MTHRSLALILLLSTCSAPVFAEPTPASWSSEGRETDAREAVTAPPLGRVATAALQFSVPFLTHAVVSLTLVGLELNEVAYPGSAFAGIAWLAAYPILAGFWTGIVGDLWGPDRGTVLWPVLAGVLGSVVTAALVAAYALSTFAVLAAANPQWDDAELERQFDTHPALQGGGYVLFTLNAVLAAGLPLVAYALTSEPKETGDDGSFGVPGLLTPSHPTLAR
jgi:hypothetical protein